MTKSSRNFSSTPEKTFFKHHTDNISRIQSRLYGIRATPEELKIFLLSPTTAENINIRVSKILQNDTNIFRRLAYIWHTGTRFAHKTAHHIEKNILSNLEHGRGFEMLFLESLIMQTKRNDLHFRPPKDMDGLYKIDALSRILGENSHKTIAFGTQLSLANIEENFSEEIFGKKHKKMDEKNPKTYDSKYQKKFNEIKEIAQIMEKPNARESTEQFFGRISTPDIFCYTAINGIVKKKFAKEVRCLKKYFETWKEENFEKNGLLEYCHPDLQAVIGVVARHHLETQKYLISENFLEHCENNTEIITPQGEIILKNGEKIFFLKKDIWNAKTQEFTSELYSFSHREGVENSTLCAKSVYFLSENILAKMRKNIKK